MPPRLSFDCFHSSNMNLMSYDKHNFRSTSRSLKTNTTSKFRHGRNFKLIILLLATVVYPSMYKYNAKTHLVWRVTPQLNTKQSPQISSIIILRFRHWTRCIIEKWAWCSNENPMSCRMDASDTLPFLSLPRYQCPFQRLQNARTQRFLCTL